MSEELDRRFNLEDSHGHTAFEAAGQNGQFHAPNTVPDENHAHASIYRDEYYHGDEAPETAQQFMTFTPDADESTPDEQQLPETGKHAADNSSRLPRQVTAPILNVDENTDQTVQT